MKTEQIVMCVVAILLGMLLLHMLKGVCGCKLTEGQSHGPFCMLRPLTPGDSHNLTLSERHWRGEKSKKCLAVGSRERKCTDPCVFVHDGQTVGDVETMSYSDFSDGRYNIPQTVSHHGSIHAAASRNPHGSFYHRIHLCRDAGHTTHECLALMRDPDSGF